MNRKIEDAAREQIMAFLPDALAKALTSYQEFAARGIAEENGKVTPSAFKEHHNAGKVAIAHIELLLKLARWSDLEAAGAAEGANEQAVLMALMREAEGELAAYRKKSGPGGLKS